MLFTSLDFGIFFSLVVVIYYVIPSTYKWMWLLATSCYFYASFIPIYLAILFSLISVTYLAANIMAGLTGKPKTLIFILGITLNVAVLGLFKYYDFLAINLGSLAAFLHWNYSLPLLAVALPVGLSFQTFQCISYLFEVYRSRFNAEKHFGIFSTYILFFPKLVAGPIEKPEHLLPQFRETMTFDADRICKGLKLIAWGLFQKVIIADHLSMAVDSVYMNPENRESLSYIIAAICFSLQLYCDFSGYSDIARGVSHVLGFRLMKNFNRPYFSKSITEFWRRWHISLSEWVRSYLFTPLSFWTRYLGIFGFIISVSLTFLIVGLWHGANWTFVIFGGLQGLAIALEWFSRKMRKKISSVFPSIIWNVLGVIYTFGFWTFSLVFFRSDSVTKACQYINSMLLSIRTIWSDIFHFEMWRITLLHMSLSKWEWLLVISSILFLMTMHWLERQESLISIFSKLPLPVKIAANYIFFFMIFCFGKFDKSQFIYFQF
jgi:alginate O-acetyltransferase complex protein AlgI